MQAQLGRMAEATAAFQTALKLQPDIAFAHCGLGRLLLQSGDARAALVHFQKAERARPADPCVQAGLAQAYARNGSPDKAAAAAVASRACKRGVTLSDPLQDAVMAYAVSSLAASQRAAALMSSGEPARALPLLERYARTHPRDALVHATLAVAYAQTAKRQAAEEAYERTMVLRKQFLPVAREGSGLTCASHNLDLVLVEYWTDMLDLVSRGADRDVLRETLTTFTKIADQLPLDERALLGWGNALLQAGDIAGAIAEYRAAASVNPEYTKAYSNLGVALEAQNDLDAAVAAYQRAAELAPADPAVERLATLRTRITKGEAAHAAKDPRSP